MKLRFNPPFGQSALLPLLSALLMLAPCWSLPAEATQLPAGLKAYLNEQDAGVKVRFDGLVTFSNGERYVPVIPQAPKVADSQVVVWTYPAGLDYPDLIRFDNDYYLLRLVHTDKGRLVLPKLPDYPVSLLEGMLPQDLVLPPNLFIPVELKVILGALPYNPEFDPARANEMSVKPPVKQPNNFPAKAPATVKAPNQPTATSEMQTATAGYSTLQPVPRTEVPEMLYVYDVNVHKLVALDPVLKKTQGSMSLECVPSRIKSSTEGYNLYVACLTSDELLVVDTSANLIKTRLKVGSKPDDVLVLPEAGEALISHRFSKFVSRVDTRQLIEPQQLALPGPSGAMVALPKGQAAETQAVLVADAFSGKVYRLNMLQHVVDQTYNTLPNISAMWVKDNQLWLASRSQHQVQVVDLTTGKEVALIEVGKKPLELLPVGERLYVLSAQDNRLDVLDWKARTAVGMINLKEGMFPSGMVLGADGETLYVLGAGAEGLSVVDLMASSVKARLELPVRGAIIVRAGGVRGDDTSTTANADKDEIQEMEAVSLDEADTKAVPPMPQDRSVKQERAVKQMPEAAGTLFPALPALQENVLK